ncbi:MAG TPA: hypothetical protein VG433_11665 [Pirellulales bacterium]|nr:hypothetical protein [Pirellulales bacterium]
MTALRLLIPVLLVLLVGQPASTLAATPELDGWVRYLDSLLPTKAADYKAETTEKVVAAANGVDDWSAYAATRFDGTPATALGILRQLLATKTRVDQMLDRALQQRAEFALLDAGIQRACIRSYLRVDSKLIDLSGRLRYLLADMLFEIAGDVTDPALRGQWLALLSEFRSSIGATAVSAWLAATPPAVPAAAQTEPSQPRGFGRRFGRRQDSAPPPAPVPALPAVDNTIALGVLRLIAASGEASLLPRVAEFVRQPQLSPELVLAAAETIKAVGLPQNVRPGTPTGVPSPAITATELYDRLAQLDGSRLDPTLAARRAEIMNWLDTRRRSGLTEDSYTLGTFQVQSGDWLLMRNPSPYNLFTDLSPGLFTHVGVVTTEQGADGIRRMVLVDLQEHGRMSTVNIEIFVQRSLHYMFMRHPDPAVARQMAEAARSVIGNETEFDLNFRTERVLELAHQPLAGKKIRTYCAGLLLLCALQTSADRSEFFPVVEYAAGGHTVENLALLGMSVGKDFISPTGALYSSKLLLVGRREPMYEPRRQIEEAVYDDFATGLVDKKLAPAPELFDSLRYKMAQAAHHSPLLAQALASAAGINADADLRAAARAAAVLETLDEVAQRASAEFDAARNAVRREVEELPGLPPADAAAAKRYRERHADLVKLWAADQLSPRDLRIRLVDYYIAQGRREIDRQFFAGKSEAQPPAGGKPVSEKPAGERPAG